MKYHKLLSGIAGMFFFSYHFSFSQNLVVNPSFEDTISCPQNLGKIELAAPWFNPTTNTPDYFHSCCECAGSISVPSNIAGFQIARIGLAYAGITTIYSTANGRDYIANPLFDSLIAGKKYCVEFYVSLADKSKFYVDKIGAYLSVDSAVDFSTIYDLPFIPQIENPSNYMLSGKDNWIKISGEIIASGGEKFITIGNFRKDINTMTDTINDSSLLPYAYYYIDDVSVYLCQCDTIAPTAKFNLTADTLTATFSNLSSSFSNYWFWDFGDGKIDTAKNPVHTYDSAGTYTVTLVAWYNGCSDTMIALITVNDVGINEPGNNFHNGLFYPNPNDGTMFFENFLNAEDIGILFIYDLTGRIIIQNCLTKENNNIRIDLMPGIYFCTLIVNNEKVYLDKIIIVR